jgi:hypothetical protein
VLVAAGLAPGCGRPTDEAWLQFLGFHASGATSMLVQITGDLSDGLPCAADADLQNSSAILGKATGTGIHVTGAHIDYQLPGFSAPSTDIPVNLWLAAPAGGAPTTGTVTAFPVVSAALKQWIIANGASAAAANLTAHVTFSGVTDEGVALESGGGIAIALTASGTPTPTASTTVFVRKSRDAVKSSSTSGQFVVVRSGSVAANLIVTYSDGGGTATSGTDYSPLPGTLTIPAGLGTATIDVIPIAAGASGRTVRVTLVGSSSYTIIEPSTDILNIGP